MRKLILLVAFLCVPYLVYALGEGGIQGGGSTNASDLTSGTIPAARIADNSVTTIKIQDDSADSIDFSAHSLLGKVLVLDNVTSPSGSKLYGGLDLMTASATVTVVAGIVGMNFCVMDGAATASNLIFDVPGTDNVILLGVEGAAGIGITNASGSTLGDYVCFMVVTANKWRVMGYQGSWVSQ